MPSRTFPTIRSSPPWPATCTGSSPGGACSASATPRECSRSTRRPATTTARCSRAVRPLVAGRAARARSRAAARGARRRAAGRAADGRGRRAARPERGAAAPGIPLCPPEGDAGTGMVATERGRPAHRQRQRGHEHLRDGRARAARSQQRAPRTRRRDDAGRATRRDGALQQRRERARRLGGHVRAASPRPRAPDSTPTPCTTRCSARRSTAKPDAGGLLAYNQLAGEPIAGLDEGRPLVVRTPRQPLHARQLHARPALRRVRHAEPRHAGARTTRASTRPDVRARRHVPHRGGRAAVSRRPRSTRPSPSPRPHPRAAPGASPCSPPIAAQATPGSTSPSYLRDRVFAGHRARDRRARPRATSRDSPPTSTATAPASPSSAPPSRRSDRPSRSRDPTKDIAHEPQLIIPDLKTHEVWFLTGSQGLYGEETLEQVAEQSQEVARSSARHPRSRSRSCGSRC